MELKENEVFEHLMLDIETMGNESFSSIISIGALEFNINTGNTGREFYVNVDLQSCINLGLKVNADTIMWWMDQSDEARKSLMSTDAVSINVALCKLSKFFIFDYQVWGNSARFDCGIIENAFNKCGLKLPWEFWNERDVRTLVSFDPEAKKNCKFSGVAHNALSDCYHQAKYCSEIWMKLNK